ncbi:MAG: serine/threonine-protein kinase [Methylococcales bacterium]
MIGKTIGNFQITHAIAAGGIGEVYAGVDLMLEREVAIKALRPELMSRPDVVQRFRTEAITLAKLNHNQIATVYAFLAEGVNYYLVMELVQGWTLQEIIAHQGAISSPVALALCQQALCGIAFAHQNNVIHRDIKPANIMLSCQGDVKVMDFGIARVLGTERMTRSSHVIGTLEYMAPEQIRCEETDVRTDIYSLGILLYEMVTGRIPFICNSEYDLLRAQVEMQPPRPGDFSKDISRSLEACITRALAKAPQDRYQTAEEFAQALQQCEESQAGVINKESITGLLGLKLDSTRREVKGQVSAGGNETEYQAGVLGRQRFVSRWIDAGWFLQPLVAAWRSLDNGFSRKSLRVLPADIPILLPFLAITLISLVFFLYHLGNVSADRPVLSPVSEQVQVKAQTQITAETVSIDPVRVVKPKQSSVAIHSPADIVLPVEWASINNPVIRQPVSVAELESVDVSTDNTPVQITRIVVRKKLKPARDRKGTSGWVIKR